MDIVGLGWVTS